MGIEKEGSITFTLKHEHKDWATNDSGYRFGTVKISGVSVEAVKNPDRTVQLKVSGPLGKDFEFRTYIPECDERGLFVAITWKEPEINLYLNGKLVETKKSINR
jgi:hypothetical protein